MSQFEKKSGLLIGGGLFVGFLSSLCCVGPLVLTLMGVSGAASLAKLDVLRIPMIIIVVILFGFAGFSLYRKRNVCEPGSICADPKKFKRMVIAYWLGLIISIGAITSPYWIVWIYG